MLRLILFGAPRLERDGQAIPLRRKGLGLLAYLAVTGRPQGRDTLLSLLWPEFDQPSARNNLRRELSLLRSALMRLYARDGQPAAALRQYEEGVRLLAAELGAAPDPETTARPVPRWCGLRLY